MDIINIYENYKYYFNQDCKAVFELCSKVACENSYKIYLIGGLVRDMLLGVKSLDIDITVEGDAIEFARVLEREAGAKISSVHEDFGTVKVEILGQKIDFASTRSETYPKKGHLPKVEKIGCSLKEDVSRRDFTVNSLAMSLNSESFGDLIDYVGGYADLKAKKIRVLHDKSFIDDPTRIIRALKYSTRLGFAPEGKTLKLQQEYLKNINYDMGIKRIKQEFKKTFDAPVRGAFEKFIEQGIYKLIANKTVSQKNIESLIENHKPKHPWLVYFGVVVISENLEKFELTKSEREIIEGAKNLLAQKFEDDFELYKLLSAQKLETLTILAALGREKEVLHYLIDLKNIKLHITGKDVLALGIKPSKDFGACFDYVLREKLKNPALKKSEELELFKDCFANF